MHTIAVDILSLLIPKVSPRYPVQKNCRFGRRLPSSNMHEVKVCPRRHATSSLTIMSSLGSRARLVSTYETVCAYTRYPVQKNYRLGGYPQATYSNLTRSVYQHDWIALIQPIFAQALSIEPMFRHRWFTPHIYMHHLVY